MKDCHFFNAALFTFLALALNVSNVAQAESPNGVVNQDRPNIVLMMVDDMGFSDLGCYGGEMDTPNLDQLAKTGLRYTQFYNCAKCETTRATLLTGRYYPEVNNTELANSSTIAEALKVRGYRTMMTGKWHVKSTPRKRGFERYFGHLSGATNFFTGDDTFLLDDAQFNVPQSGFYTTDANVDYAMQFLDEWKRDHSKNPFFLYIAFNAPHYPLQAPEEDVKKYRGKYLSGWDELRKQRFAKQKEIGLLPESTQLAPRPDDVPAWDDIPEADKDHHDMMMSTFAGMIDRVDQNIGRLLEKLDQLDVRENTVIMFLDDNGACPFQRSKKDSIENNLRPWDPKSYWCYDKRWAHACNTPFREYKQNQHEGGITSPLIISWPVKMKEASVGGRIIRQPSHLVDIKATCVDLAGEPTTKPGKGKPGKGNSLKNDRGISLVPHMLGKTRKDHEWIFFSFYGKNNAIRSGDWKLVNINFKDFELYDLSTDRTELNDLAKSNPDQFRVMKQKWEAARKEVGLKMKKKNPKKKKNKAKK